jgi:hypothetical protein
MVRTNSRARLPLARILEVGVAVEQQAARLFEVHAPLADGNFDRVVQLAHEGIGIELHIVQHFADRVALDDRFQYHVPLRTEADMHSVRVAEQVVQVAENLLVRADEEHAEVVRFAGEWMQRQRAFDVASIDELIEFA